MSKKRLIIYIMFYLLLFFVAIPNEAKANFVDDCFKENSDCFKEQEIQQDSSKNEDNKSDSQNLEHLQSDSFGFSIAKVVIALLIIIGLIYLMIKLINRQYFSSMKGNLLQNLGGISLGQNKSIQIVRIGEHIYLLGVGENVELLKEITDPNIINELTQKKESPSPVNSIFKKLNLFHSQKMESNKQNDDFTSLFSKELNKLVQSRKTISKKSELEEDIDE